MTKNSSVQILSIDAKDLYDAMHVRYPAATGYDVRDQDGQLRLNRFINTIDYSLELRKLRSVYRQAVRNSQFSIFWQGKEYTQQVINVTFKYSYKEWNKLVRYFDGREHTYYIRAGYVLKDMEFSDCVAYSGNVVIGIETGSDVETPVADEKLGKAFSFNGECYVHHASQNPTLKTREELRHELYNNGFVCDGIKYVRFKRSSGSSRIGKCLFINEKLYSRMHTWEKCGITVRKGARIDLAAWEAYIGLTMSSIIDTLELRPENILLIDDYKSVVHDRMLAVGLDGTWLTAEPKVSEKTNCIWDGQSLLDTSLFEGYEDRGMLLLRTRFFKSACFNTNIQQFFRDNGITDVSQLKGQTRAQKIEDIKLITTPSSVKYLKFGKFDEWLDRLEPEFGIVKYDKPSHYFDGRMVQAHYQLLNTLHMSKEDTKKLLQPSHDYLDQLNSDPAVLRNHVKRDPTAYRFYPSAVANDVVFYFLGVNDDFARTKMYHNFKQKLIYAYKSNLKKGHVLVHGTYATLFSNPYEMLKASVGMFDGTSTLGVGKVSCSMFGEGARILGSRSPHVAAGNILLTDNVSVSEIETYFNLSKQIVCINCIGDNILERLSGADMDSDTMLLTDNELMVAQAEKHYDDFLVPTNLVPAQNMTRTFTDEDKADLDYVTSSNKIGEIVNLSQELNSLFWDRLNNGENFEDVADIYCDIAKLDVLSNIEIDRAKRECVVDSVAEMKKIRQKYIVHDRKGRKTKPFFFAHIARGKGYYNPKRNYYRHHKTTMDYVQEIIAQWRWQWNGEYKPLGEVFHMKYYSPKYAKQDQAHSILRMLRETSSLLNRYWKEFNDADDDAKESLRTRISELMENRSSYIRDCSLSASTIYYMLGEIEKPEYSDIRQTFFNIVFGYPIPAFRELVKESTDAVPWLVEDREGDVELFDFKFSRRVIPTERASQTA